MDAPPSVRSLGVPTESGKPMPHCSSRASGCFALPQELGRSLESRGGRYGSSRPIGFLFLCREKYSTCRRLAHVRNGLSLDSIRTRHQLLDLVSAHLVTDAAAGIYRRSISYARRSTISLATRENGSAENPRNIFAANTS